MRATPRTVTGLRWREDTGVEFRCRECGHYWPLAEDFWEFRSFARCRACWRSHRLRLNRERYAKDAAVRARAKAYKTVYDQETKAARRIKNQAYYWGDPERARAKAREYYYRHRAEVLARKKEAYWAERGAAMEKAA